MTGGASPFEAERVALASVVESDCGDGRLAAFDVALLS
jgi:hypothetical protein